MDDDGELHALHKGAPLMYLCTYMLNIPIECVVGWIPVSYAVADDDGMQNIKMACQDVERVLEDRGECTTIHLNFLKGTHISA